MKTIVNYSTKKGGLDDSMTPSGGDFKKYRTFLNIKKEKQEHSEVDAAPSISEIEQEIRVKEAMRN